MKLKLFLLIFLIFLFGITNTLSEAHIFEPPRIVQLLQEKKNIIEKILTKYKNLPFLEDEIPRMQTNFNKNQVNVDQNYYLSKISPFNSYLRHMQSKKNNFHLTSYNSNKIMDSQKRIETNKVIFNESFRFLENNYSNANIPKKFDIMNRSMNKNSAERTIENNLIKGISKVSTNNMTEDNTKLNSGIKESLHDDSKNDLKINNLATNDIIALTIAKLNQTKKTFQNISSFKDFPNDILKKNISLTQREKTKNSKKKAIKIPHSRIMLPSSIKKKTIFINIDLDLDIPKYLFYF